MKQTDSPLHFIAYLTRKYSMDKQDVNQLIALLHDHIIEVDDP